jgi:hypothetical protein
MASTVDLLAAADRVRKAAPTTERGAQTRFATIPGALSGLTGGLLQEAEYATAWRWPTTVDTVDRMRNDSQVEALYAAINLSVRRRRWLLDPNDAPPEIVDALASDLGLPVRGDDRDRTRGRTSGAFSWDDHLQHALLALLYGSYYFEIVGHVDDAAGGDGLWHLDKLAPRPPRTILRIIADPTGELESIVQWVSRAGAPADPLPAGVLVPYVWDREGADWYGRSVLRAIHREFDIKDRLIKVDAVKHQRNGMGVPIPHVTDQSVGKAAQGEALKMASALRAGEEAGGVAPYGIDMRILGVQGNLPDTLASIREHNEAMARRFHAMFMMLGQTSHGSRALGEQFVDFFALNTDGWAGWLGGAFTQSLIERWVTWNYGPDERAPRLVSERDETPEIAVADILTAVQSGALTADAGLEQWLRDRYGLPDLDPSSPPRTAPAPAARRRAPAAAAASVDDVKLPDRPLRRQPNVAEAAAGVDFAAIEQAYVDAVDELAAGLATLRADQITDLVAQVKAAGDDLEALAQISTDPVGAEQIAASMRAIARSGALDALSEARHQGVTVDEIDLSALEDEIVARAEAVAQTLAADVSNTAARAAVRLSGVTGLEGDLADSVATYLGALKWQLATDAARGVLQGAQNAGRFGQFDAVEQAAEATTYYHSALLDTNTCGPCADQDGYEYTDLQDVEASFAGLGGYALCEGAERCRCTAVAVVGEAAPTLQ